jgi:hypothetical protein
MGEEHQLCAKQCLSRERINTEPLLRKSLIIEARWFSTMLIIMN